MKYLLLAFFPCVFVVAACSSTPGPAPASQDAGAPAADASGDAMADATLVLAPEVCPTTPPPQGSPCLFSPSLRCEMDYVPSKSARCSPSAACRDRAWDNNSVYTCEPCPQAKPKEGSYCPMFGDIDPASCSYGQDNCHCKYSTSSGYHEWSCTPRTQEARCPKVRPRLGSPCDVARDPQNCQYVGCDDGARTMICARGVWACLSAQVGVVPP
jgi:hypothetical protein